MSQESKESLTDQLPLVVFAVGTVFFVLQLLAGMSWMDAGELTAAAGGLGISHPPGHPGHALLGKLVTFLPIGEVATRLSLLSALGAGATLAAVVALVQVLSKKDEGAALVAILLLALTPALRINATRPEVYTMCTALSSWSLVFALRFHRGREPHARDALLAVFCVSLAALFHPAIALAVALPVGVALLLRARERAKALLLPALALLVLAGCGTLYLWVRANAKTPPLLEWGTPDTLSALVDHLSASLYGENVGLSGLGERLGQRVALLGEGSGAALLFVGVAGLIFAAVSGLSGVVLLIAVAVMVLLGGALQAAFNPDMRAYLLMTQVMLTVGLTLAVAAAKRALPESLIQSDVQKQLMSAALALPVFAFAMAAGPSEASRLDRSDDVLRLWDESVALMPPGPGLYMARGDHTLFPSQYERLIAGARPDIAIANRELVRDRWFLEHLDRQLPALYLPFIDDQIKGQIANRLVIGNLQQGRPVAGDLMAPVEAPMPGVAPMGRAFRYAPVTLPPSSVPVPEPLESRTWLSSKIDGQFAYELARYYNQRGDRVRAARALGAWTELSDKERSALEAPAVAPSLEASIPRKTRLFLHSPWVGELLLDDLRYQSGLEVAEPHPERPFEMRLHAAWRAVIAEQNPRHPTLTALGPEAVDITLLMLVQTGNGELAETELRRRIESEEVRADDLAMLASLLGNRGPEGLRESLALFTRATELAPDNDENWARRGLAAAKLGQMDEARRSWSEALRLAPHRRDVAQWLSSLNPPQR